MLLIDPECRRRLALAFLANARSNYLTGRAAQAASDYEAVLLALPDNPDALHGYGMALASLNRFDEARGCFANLLHYQPDDADTLNNHALSLAKLGRHEAALADYARALQSDADRADICFNQGLSEIALDRTEAAVASFRQAVALRPGFIDALHNLGSLYILLWRHEEAAECFDQLVRHEPAYPYALGKLFYTRQFCCDWGRFDEDIRLLRAAVETGNPLITPFAYLAASSGAAHERRNAEITARRFPQTPIPALRRPHHLNQRIRVAYLSADFHDHATSYLMAGMFEQHDRRRFETFAISYGPDTGGMRQRIKEGFDHFLDVRLLTDAAVADLIAELNIDIAVDLKGHTTHARPGILAYRPAPVQVNYMGYPGTTALPYLDYIVADAVVIPPDEQDAYTEKVVTLPDSYLATDDQREVSARRYTRQEMGLPEQGFVFCCFNNSGKLTPGMFALWMRLLLQVQGSVLWLMTCNAAATRNLQAEARRMGVDSGRLVFADVMPSAEHLARLALADLFLDTLPVNAHTTACDALWGGLPVLTCPGNTFAGRVASSLLHAAGLPELICHDLQEYETRALELAASPDRLAELRTRWQAQRLSCRLFDTRRFCRHLESAYEIMMQRSLAGEMPQGFAVRPLPNQEPATP